MAQKIQENKNIVMSKEYNSANEIYSDFWNKHFPLFNDKGDNRILKWHGLICEYHVMEDVKEKAVRRDIYNGESIFIRLSTIDQIIESAKKFNGIIFDEIPTTNIKTGAYYLLLFRIQN